MPGILTSRIRQDALCAFARLKNCSADPKTEVANPYARNRRCRASRTALSSSTIEISGSIGPHAYLVPGNDTPVSLDGSIGPGDTWLPIRNTIAALWFKRTRFPDHSPPAVASGKVKPTLAPQNI